MRTEGVVWAAILVAATLCAAPLRAASPVAQPGTQAEAEIELSAKSILLDERLDIRVRGLPPQARVVLEARTQRLDQTWSAQASFVADDAGLIDLAKQAPVAGSYAGTDAMGLIWSIEPPAGAQAREKSGQWDVNAPRRFELIASIDDHPVAKASFEQRIVDPAVRTVDLRELGLRGRLYLPGTEGSHPAVLVLGGAEGGQDDISAGLLASHGYAALALSYFGSDGVPDSLVEIPLEYFRKALDWLKQQPGVDAQRLGVLGRSKGGELALLLASHSPDLRAVVAISPSSVVWSGIGGNYHQSSWSRDGKPLPFVQFRASVGFILGFVFRPSQISTLEGYQEGLTDADEVASALIPVEKIAGGVLLATGSEDKVWPSATMAEQIVARLKAQGFAHKVLHLNYANAGHVLSKGYSPIKYAMRNSRLGGSVEGSVQEMEDFGPKALQFLREELGQ